MNPLSMLVTADSLHVRNQPSRAGASLGFVNREMAVEVTQIDDTGLWGKVNTNGMDGWCSLKHLLPAGAGATRSPWLEVAHREIGVKERPGPDSHPRIYEYMATVDNLTQADMVDDTPWCSCFVNWCVEQSGHNGTNHALAQSWKKWRSGKPADSVRPGSETPALIGDIAVGQTKSPDSGKGHVGFFIAYDAAEDKLLLLGGNQSNAVRYSWYPRESNNPYGRLLTLRSL